VVFVSFTHKEGVFDEYGNEIKMKKDPDQIEIHESEWDFPENESKFSSLNYFLTRRRFKKGIKYLPALLYLQKVILIGSTIFFP